MSNIPQELLDSVVKLDIQKDDVAILKGEWEQGHLANLATAMSAKGKDNIILVIKDDQSIEKMTLEEVDQMLTEIKKRILSNEKTETT